MVILDTRADIREGTPVLATPKVLRLFRSDLSAPAMIAGAMIPTAVITMTASRADTTIIIIVVTAPPLQNVTVLRIIRVDTGRGRGFPVRLIFPAIPTALIITAGSDTAATVLAAEVQVATAR